MDPITIALIATATVQAGSGLLQAEAIRNQARINEKFAEMNAVQAEIDAYEAEKFGYTESARYETIVNNVLSDQRLAFAAQDIDASFGTAADIQTEAKFHGFLNVLDIQKAARERAKGFKLEARNQRLSARLGGIQASMNAGAATTQGIASAAQTGINYYSSQSKKQG
ncbi:MAG: hypothetical protein ACRCV5_22705 [Afipia sp.]